MEKRLYLVEIRAKDWVRLPHNQSRALAYEEVYAFSELGARYAGIDQFSNRVKYSPSIRKKLDALGVSSADYCAPDAVEIDYHESY